MKRNPKKKARPQRGEVREFTIDRLAYGGNGVGRLEDDGAAGAGMAAFVPRTAPGDRVLSRLEKVQRRHAEGSLEQVVEPGPDRIEPPCPHYAEGCGGCSWQHLDYERQVAAKQDIVRESLRRIGGFEELPMRPIVPADDPWWYRNKMEFSFHARDGLGLHRAGDWRRVVAVSDCRLESELAMRVLAFARDFAGEHGLSSWDPLTKEGLLRELHVRHGRNTGQTMVGLVTSPGAFEHGRAFGRGVASLDDTIVSVVHAVRGTDDGSPILSITPVVGREVIEENVGGLTFELGLQTFFQTNTAQAERMLELVRDAVAEGLEAAPEADHSALLIDVFCGVGFFTLGLASLVGRAAGVEIVEDSIVAARDNAARNHVGNTAFYAGDARHTLPAMIEEHGHPTIVVLDPPRGGAGGKVMRRIARSCPTRIVYVSCNPTTLARDLQELGPFGYTISSVQPLDLFPQTYHVETIVVLDRAPGEAGDAE